MSIGIEIGAGNMIGLIIDVQQHFDEDGLIHAIDEAIGIQIAARTGRPPDAPAAGVAHEEIIAAASESIDLDAITERERNGLPGSVMQPTNLRREGNEVGSADSCNHVALKNCK